MELKEANNSPTSVGKNVAMISDGNNSGNHRSYEILFPAKEDSADQNTENNDPDKYFYHNLKCNNKLKKHFTKRTN